MIVIVMRKLRKMHQPQVGRKLRIIVKILKESHKKIFI